MVTKVKHIIPKTRALCSHLRLKAPTIETGFVSIMLTFLQHIASEMRPLCSHLLRTDINERNIADSADNMNHTLKNSRNPYVFFAIQKPGKWPT